jgi:hypothetical protein
VEGYFQAIWRRCITDEDAVFYLDGSLCAFAVAGCELEPFLREWEQCRRAQGYGKMREFIDSNTVALIRKRTLSGGFWNAGSGTIIVDWLLSPATKARLGAIFDAAASSDFADELALLIDRMEILQRSAESF